MRILVLFDLPTKTKIEKQSYIKFRRFLLKDGYDMIQYSVYARIVNGNDAFNKHLKRLNENVPSKGSIRCMQVSEKQFTKMILVVGERKKQEKAVFEKQLILL